MRSGHEDNLAGRGNRAAIGAAIRSQAEQLDRMVDRARQNKGVPRPGPTRTNAMLDAPVRADEIDARRFDPHCLDVTWNSLRLRR